MSPTPPDSIEARRRLGPSQVLSTACWTLTRGRSAQSRRPQRQIGLAHRAETGAVSSARATPWRNGPESYAELWRNSNVRSSSAHSCGHFHYPGCGDDLGRTFCSRQQTDIEDSCKSSGGQYSSEQVTPHFGSAPTLIEKCCTNAGASNNALPTAPASRADVRGLSGNDRPPAAALRPGNHRSSAIPYFAVSSAPTSVRPLSSIRSGSLYSSQIMWPVNSGVSALSRT